VSRPVPALIALCAILLSAVLLVGSCGYSGDPYVTSPALGIAATKGSDMVVQFGDAVISYLNGKGDLASVQRLVAPSAQASLTEMLSALGKPTGCEVRGMANYGGNDVDVDLRFTGDSNGPADFTVRLLVDPDKGTMMITGVKPGYSGMP
jgi:hypothetical protein